MGRSLRSDQDRRRDARIGRQGRAARAPAHQSGVFGIEKPPPALDHAYDADDDAALKARRSRARAPPQLRRVPLHRARRRLINPAFLELKNRRQRSTTHTMLMTMQL